jgi:pyruvate,water dikinase
MNYLLKGQPASRGLAHGRVAIVNDWRTGQTLTRGCILVARFPLPVLAPALNRAEGLVCAYGGALANLIILAREFRVPAVIGLGEALTQLDEGDEIWVDGNTGIVSGFDPRGAWQVAIQNISYVRSINHEISYAAFA